MPMLIPRNRFSGDLSDLEIDANKDWDRNQITNSGGVSTQGTEMISDNGFDTPGDWTVTGTCVITGSEANYGTVLGSGTCQPNPALTIVPGEQYIATYTITGLRNADIQFSCGGYTGPTRYNTGTYSEVFTASSSANSVWTGTIAGGAKTSCKIDDAYLKPIGDLDGSIIIRRGLLYGNLELNANGASDIGDTSHGVRKIFIGNDTAGAYPLPDFRGLAFEYSGGDCYVGNDNVYPGYYVQKTVVHGSTKQDNTDDYTNLYQGDSGYPALAMMYDIERTVSPHNGVVIGNGATDPCGIWYNGFSFETRFDNPNDKFVMLSQTGECAFLEIGLDHATAQEAVRPDTDDKIDIGDLTNSLMFKDAYFSGTVDAIGGFAVNTAAGHTGWFDDGVNFRVTVTGGIITAIAASSGGGFA